MQTMVLENKSIRAEFSPATGALTALVSKATGWNLLPRPELGLSFGLQVPTPGRRATFVKGEQQRLSAVRMSADGGQAVFTWNGVTTQFGEALDITLTGTVTIDAAGLTFALTLDNRSPHTIEVAAYPCLGGVRPQQPGQRLMRSRMSCFALWQQEIYPHFRNTVGYWGAHHPTDTETKALDVPFILLEDGTQGFYIGRHAVDPRHLITYFLQAKPGYLESQLSLLSTEDNLGGHANAVELMIQQFCYVAPGAVYTTDPIAVCAYKGDWTVGVDSYKAWRKTWFKRPPVPAWADDIHSWLQVQIYSAEDNATFRYKDLPEIARECKAQGIQAIQLTGWAFGGQDRGNPSHDTDDALGSREEFKAAIRECQAMGVKVILFTKWTWVDQAMPNYKTELEAHTAKNPWGYPYPAGGYNYFTWTQLSGIGTNPLVPTCTASPAWQQKALEEFRKVLDLGADGMLFDELVHHGSATYCFDRTHDHPQPAFLYAYDRALARLFRAEAAKAHPEFLFSGEFWREEQMLEYSMGYTRFGGGHVALNRYIDSRFLVMMAVPGFADRNHINKCLECRYIISYEPFNFKGRPGDAPATVAYGQTVDALRRRYREFLWDGEHLGPREATVRVNGQPSTQFSAYRAADGRRALAVCNPDPTAAWTVEVAFASPLGRRVVAVSPEAPDPVAASGSLTLPPRSVLVVMEV